MGSTIRIFLLLACILLLVPLVVQAQSQELKATSDTVLYKLERQLYSIKPEKGELIPVYFVQLDDLKFRIDTLKKYTQVFIFADSLIITRLSKASHYFDSIKPLILAKMARIDLVMYEEALKSKNIGDSIQAEQLFIKSLQHNASFAPAAYELIKLNLQTDKYSKAIQFYESFGTQIDTATNPYYFNLIHNLIPQILDVILASSLKMNLKGIPSDAFIILKDAEMFNAKHASLQGKEKIKLAYKAAHEGMYQSLNTIAERAFAAKKWDLAQYYYSMAQNYQSKNAEYLPYPSKSQQGLASTITASEKELLLEKQTAKPKKHSWKRRTVKVKEKKILVKQVRGVKNALAKPEKDTLVNFYICLADSSLIHKRYYSCIQWSDSAFLYNDRKHSVPDSIIQNLYAKAGRIIILDTVHAAYYLAWKNEISAANKSLNLATSLQSKYFLRDDDEVTKAIAELISRIQDRKCFTAKSEYEALIYRALSQFIRSDFLEGRDYLAQARLILEKNLDCPISDSLLLTTQSAYHGLIAWQEHWNESKQAISVKDYQTFYKEYTAAYTVYLSEKLENKGLNVKPIAKYIEDQKDLETAKELAFISLKAGNIEGCREFLLILKNNGINPHSIAALLEISGENMAVHDKSDLSNYWLGQLNASGSWFRIAKKAYFRRLKSKIPEQHESLTH